MSEAQKARLRYGCIDIWMHTYMYVWVCDLRLGSEIANATQPNPTRPALSSTRTNLTHCTSFRGLNWRLLCAGPQSGSLDIGAKRCGLEARRENVFVQSQSHSQLDYKYLPIVWQTNWGIYIYINIFLNFLGALPAKLFLRENSKVVNRWQKFLCEICKYAGAHKFMAYI